MIQSPFLCTVKHKRQYAIMLLDLKTKRPHLSGKFGGYEFRLKTIRAVFS